MEQPTKKSIQIKIERIDETKYLFYDFTHPIYNSSMTAVFQDIRKDLRSEFKLDIETATVVFYDEDGRIAKASRAENHAELAELITKLENFLNGTK